MNATSFLLTCKPDFEKVLIREIALCGLLLKEEGPGWILTERSGAPEKTLPVRELCFACFILENPVIITATSSNGLAEKLVDFLAGQIGTKKIEGPLGSLFFSSGDEKLIHYAETVQSRFAEKFRKKISRVAKLLKDGIPSGHDFSEGLFVHFTDFNQARVSFRARSQGQQRMKMDPQAPARSYLKIEEAFYMMGHAPRPNDTVVDLGAAPGGWSLGALKRGAMVTAVDNGPLKEPVQSHPNLHHLKEDALKFYPDEGVVSDWLLCDILDRPDIIFAVLQKWFSRRWCRYFVVNLKVGRMDPVLLLKKIRDEKEGLAPHCRSLTIRQLYHDREEITLMGELKAAAGRNPA
ncbi:MAG: rRNA methyltransferase [Candidatus Omnitrophica bacterium]|nr:rRNA methyltransferase [Candidatus Omnitrophota bacterium]